MYTIHTFTLHGFNYMCFMPHTKKTFHVLCHRMSAWFGRSKYSMPSMRLGSYKHLSPVKFILVLADGYLSCIMDFTSSQLLHLVLNWREDDLLPGQREKMQKVGFSRRGSWAAVKSQQKPQPIPPGALELGWPSEVVLNSCNRGWTFKSPHWPAIGCRMPQSWEQT